MKKIEQGQIWEIITENFFTSGEKERERNGNRQTKLKKGEKIEIRYPYAWHFRTTDNYYFHASSKMIINNCKLLGKIWGKIRFRNRAKLEEILRLRLYNNKE